MKWVKDLFGFKTKEEKERETIGKNLFEVTYGSGENLVKAPMHIEELLKLLDYCNINGYDNMRNIKIKSEGDKDGKE